MLARVVTRASRAKTLDEVVVATTIKPADDVIVEMCMGRRWSHSRGSEIDALDRYYRAALAYNADIVVRITSDCPLIDPEIIDSHVNRMRARWHEIDFVSNMMRQTFPLGLAVEVMPFDVLTRMHRLSTTDYEKEHVTTLAYEKPGWFVVDHIVNDVDLSGMRWTVDTAEDMAFVRLIYEHFRHDCFSWREILAVLEQYPEWPKINQHVKQKVI
jgi:spore coat polysaccharide biosynthesis protein SpsF